MDGAIVLYAGVCVVGLAVVAVNVRDEFRARSRPFRGRVIGGGPMRSRPWRGARYHWIQVRTDTGEIVSITIARRDADSFKVGDLVVKEPGSPRPVVIPD